MWNSPKSLGRNGAACKRRRKKERKKSCCHIHWRAPRRMAFELAAWTKRNHQRNNEKTRPAKITTTHSDKIFMSAARGQQTNKRRNFFSDHFHIYTIYIYLYLCLKWVHNVSNDARWATSKSPRTILWMAARTPEENNEEKKKKNTHDQRQIRQNWYWRQWSHRAHLANEQTACGHCNETPNHKRQELTQ